MSAVTTTASFTIPAVSGAVNAFVTDTTPWGAGTFLTVSDGTHAAVMQVNPTGGVVSGTEYNLITIAMLAGSTGNTMGSGANVLPASVPLSALPTNPSPTGSDQTYCVSPSGTSYKVALSAYTGILGPLASLHTAQQSISSIIHQWRCNDAAGSSTLADTVGSTALGVTGSSMIVGAPGLMNDGATGVVTSFTAGNYLSATGVIPTSGAWCIEMLFSLSMVLSTTTYGIVCAQGTGGDGSGMFWDYNANPGASTYGMNMSSFTVGSQTGFSPGSFPLLLHLESDGSANTYGYFNGVQFATTSSGYQAPSGKLYVGALEAAAYSCRINVQNIAVYNARLTSAQKYANTNAIVRR